VVRTRNLWGLSVEKVWVPFFKRCNKEGITTIPKVTLDDPYYADGSVRLGLKDMAAIVKRNFEASLIAYAEGKSGVPAKELMKKR